MTATTRRNQAALAEALRKFSGIRRAADALCPDRVGFAATPADVRRMLGLPRRPWLLPQLAWQVLVVMLLVMALLITACQGADQPEQAEGPSPAPSTAVTASTSPRSHASM